MTDPHDPHLDRDEHESGPQPGPAPVPRTVEEWLDQTRRGLIELVHCLNRDSQYGEASKIQAMLHQFEDLDPCVSEIAAWPPVVVESTDGETHWVVVVD